MVDKDVLGSAVRTVAQLMRPPTATIEAAAHLAAAAYLIKHRRASVLVVTTDRDHDPVAMLSDEEVAHAIADGRDPERTRVRQVARQRPVTVDSHAAAADAARLMLAQGVQHLLVEDGERFVGIVDLNEVCRAAPDTCGRGGTAPTSSRSS